MKKCKKCDRELLDDERFFCPRCYCEVGEKVKKGLSLVKKFGTVAIAIFGVFKVSKKS